VERSTDPANLIFYFNIISFTDFYCTFIDLFFQALIKYYLLFFYIFLEILIFEI